jgi:hydrogenase nickel incorporation protein HypB
LRENGIDEERLMCTTCGCGADEAKLEGAALNRAHRHADGVVHVHDHDGTAHAHPSQQAGAGQSRMLSIEQDILAKNDAYAAENRGLLVRRGIFALNLVSSPGAGKTALLVKTIRALSKRYAVCVIEGDQQTSCDAERIRATGARAVQINTGKGCHLDAHMVAHALARLDPPQNGMLMIENVGNLVCPAAFDLGEAHKVVVLSATEGEDKPLKYPDMFRRASLMLLNKIDLLPHLDFDLGQCVDNAHRTNQGLAVIGVSAATGEGMSEWFSWLERGMERTRRRAADLALGSSHAPEPLMHEQAAG